MTRELCLLTAVAVVAFVVVALLEMAEAGGATDIAEDRADLKSGEAGSLGLTSLASDSDNC